MLQSTLSNAFTVMAYHPQKVYEEVVPISGLTSFTAHCDTADKKKLPATDYQGFMNEVDPRLPKVKFSDHHYTPAGTGAQAVQAYGTTSAPHSKHRISESYGGIASQRWQTSEKDNLIEKQHSEQNQRVAEFETA